MSLPARPLVCPGPSCLGLHGLVGSRGFSPLFLSFYFSVLLCAKWLLLACAVLLFLLFFLCFRRPRQRALSPLGFLLALVAVGPSWSVVIAVCLCYVCFFIGPPLFVLWRLRGFSPLRLCCVLCLGVFLLQGGAWGVLLVSLCTA